MNLDLGTSKPSILTTELWLILALAKFIYMPVLERTDVRSTDITVVIAATVLAATWVSWRQWVKGTGVKAGWTPEQVNSDPKTPISDPENQAA